MNWRRTEPILKPFRHLAQQFGSTLSTGFMARTIDAADESKFNGHYAGLPFTATLHFRGSHSLKLSEATKIYPTSLSIVLKLDRPSRFHIGFLDDSFDKVLIGKTFKTQDPELDRKFTLYTYRLEPAKQYVADSRNLEAIREIHNQGWEIGFIGKKSVFAGMGFEWGKFDPLMIDAERVKKCLDQLIILAEGLKRAP